MSQKQFIFLKIKKSVTNSITFYLEDQQKKKVNFNGETMTLTQ